MFGVPHMFFSNSGASSADFLIQMNNGCQLVLSYVDYNHVKVAYAGGSSIDVILPNLTTTTVTSTGFTSVFNGTTNTFYYVYISTGNSLVFSTTAPDAIYTNQQTLGTDKVLIGYAAMTATNTMSGNWNVFSFYGQSELTWTGSFSTFGTAYAVASLPGFVIPAGKTASVSGNSSVVINLYYAAAAAPTVYHWSWSGTISGIGSWTPGCSSVNVSGFLYGAIPQVTFSTSPTHTNITNGVFNLTNVGMLMPSLAGVSIAVYDDRYFSGNACANRNTGFDGSATPTGSSASGTVTFTRPGS
jgi:hypothetical protein